ncbi:glutathione S-transferase N-terminal domain-containing protein [Shewanella sp. OMA3-2]|uniref:glutathione S-transferase N-terminal domain-containing protein n=1 Tax=Shewanella sp. OMA3-2 TaxID=2908650 RepID=UPI001F486553|nr:glutathione S-transferase N-terminal domain-containing protein [Shewanella sp. OMA3-2]UJF20625.1 glutathione S-transferase N-terminal domain-containing protein [Shewanella sp. OMA3-2]
MFVVRWILGRLILLLNFIFSPKKRQRPESEQAEIDLQTQNLSLYQYNACPFCVKVRREMRRQNLNIALVDAKQDNNKQTLLIEGGKLQVPCLKINNDGKTEWLYESKAIMNYLNDNYAKA